MCAVFTGTTLIYKYPDKIARDSWPETKLLISIVKCFIKRYIWLIKVNWF